MAIVKEIRTANVNNLIEIDKGEDNVLIIEGQEYTLQNLAPVALSFGPLNYPTGDGSDVPSALAQLALGRVYCAGGSGIKPDAASSGQFDTTRLATGHSVLGPWVWSDTTSNYYGPVDDTTGDYSSFSADFSLVASGISLFSGLNNAVGIGSFFLPEKNNRWLGVGSYGTGPNNTSSDPRAQFSTLQKNGTAAKVKQVTHRIPYINHIDDSWVVSTFMPFTTYSPTTMTIQISAFDRDTGAETVLNNAWIAANVHKGVEWQSMTGCSSSNTVAVDGEASADFYQPIMTDSDLIIYRARISDLDTGSPSISASHSSVTATFDAANNYMVVNTLDIPTHSRVFVTSSSGMPGGLASGTWYWTVRQSATQSKLAVSLLAAQNDETIDITSAGTGTLTVHVPALLLKTGGAAGEPADTSSVLSVPYWNNGGSNRQVTAWTFNLNDVNYLSVGILEPGVSTTVNERLHLYTWRLDTPSTATFLQRCETGAKGRVRSYFLLDTTRRRFLAVYDSFLIYYTFNPAIGWVEHKTIDLSVRCLGVDSIGRIWATTSEGTYITGGQKLHVFEPSGSAAHIKIEFVNAPYRYTGAPIEASIALDVYNMAGERLETSITLTRTSTNFTFAGGASSVSVTTSTEETTSVPISIIGSGLVTCKGEAA